MLTDGRTDGRTDDGRKVITIAHPEQSSGELKKKANTCNTDNIDVITNKLTRDGAARGEPSRGAWFAHCYYGLFPCVLLLCQLM